MKVGVLPRNLILSMVMGMGAIASSLALAEYPTAGVTPDQRPQGAPVITQVTHDSQWMKKCLTRHRQTLSREPLFSGRPR